MYRHTKDSEMRGHVQLFDSIADVTNTAEKRDPQANKLRQNCGGGMYNTRMPPFQQWDDVRTMCKDTWRDGLDTVQGMLEEIRRASVPKPVTTRRVRRWSDTDGEIEIDRVMGQIPEYMRESRRARRTGTRSVVLMCSVGGSWYVTNEEMLWKAAAGVACIDLLEEAGYSCEAWGWSCTNNCYVDRRHEWNFTAYKVKEAGGAVDVDLFAKSLSPWFYRTAVIECRPMPSPVCGGYGAPRDVGHARKWADKHMDLGNSKVLWVPIAYTREDAINATQLMIETIETEEND